MSLINFSTFIHHRSLDQNRSFCHSPASSLFYLFFSCTYITTIAMNLSNKQTKTPITLLTEIMSRKRLFPNFQLIYDGGSGSSTFTVRVSCDGLKAEATGRSKLDAKHNAARALLQKIAERNNLPQLLSSVTESPVRTPQAIDLPNSTQLPLDKPFYNAVGHLMDLCAINHLKDLKYETIDTVGPAHAKIYTVVCTVSTFRGVGIALTKKEAKHKAAEEMLAKISHLVSDSCFVNNRELTEKEMEKMDASIAKLIGKKYSKLSVLRKENIQISPINWGLNFINFYTAYTDIFEERQGEVLTTLKVLRDMSSQNQLDNGVENVVDNLKELFNSLDFTFDSSEIPSNDPSKYITCTRLYCYPPVNEIGVGNTKTESQVRSIENFLDTLIDFMEL
ncbi:interferon-inducible double-stranded RNA-dependent protein kinase activator A-like [Trichogramma pretiosum]|uniref:interferon-inducible double-stranded RNA-dependent protein kinase activator A-like n=1 Tax=Trichogramma pretiosum TaxID=7493 RepID=UPI0006C9C71F|nr:interferon-inducible double-stranded RNA-dependent protein kinase activator A-like [Trichogramma pretiosum]